MWKRICDETNREGSVGGEKIAEIHLGVSVEERNER